MLMPSTGTPTIAGMHAPAKQPPRPRVKRPAMVTILAGLELFNAFGYFFTLLALGEIYTQLGIVDLNGQIDLLAALPIEGWMVVALLATLSFAALAAGVLLLRMRQLGWTLTMLLTGMGLALEIYLYWAGGEVLAFWLLIYVLTVFYLNQRQVRVAFGIGGAHAPIDAEGTHA